MAGIDRPARVERLDLHNCQVDQRLAAARLCGVVDLRSGRTCPLPARHSGACSFMPKDEAMRLVQGRLA